MVSSPVGFGGGLVAPVDEHDLQFSAAVIRAYIAEGVTPAMEAQARAVVQRLEAASAETHARFFESLQQARCLPRVD